MAIDYAQSAKEIVQLIGGDDNVINLTHCATRLRFILKDNSKVNKTTLSRVKGVITVLEAGGQLQVVIGNHVADAYREVMKLIHLDENATAGSVNKVGIFSRLIDIISSIFAPFLYPLAACGVLQGIISFLAAIEVMDPASGAYRILNFVSWTGFTFLPVMVAFTAAKKFNVNPFSAVISACALVCPDYMNMLTANKIITVNSADPAMQALMKEAVNNPEIAQVLTRVVGIPLNAPSLDFFGLPVEYLSYTAAVIPIILMVWVMSYVQRFFERILPMVIRNLFTPMFCIAIMVPATLLAFGPIGNAIGGAIGGVYSYLYHLSPSIAGFVVGAFWMPLVTLGVHWGITPVTVGNYATLGYDTFTGLQASPVFAMAGAVLGVYLKAKNDEMKRVALSAGVTGLFGITEPAIYGVALRLKRPMLCGCLAGAIGGSIAGWFNAVSWSYCLPGIAVLPVFFKSGHMTQFLGFLLSISVAFVLGAVFTWIAGFKEDDEAQDETKLAAGDNPEALKSGDSIQVASPLSGATVDLTQVKDEAFSSGLLGLGIAITPSEGMVRAPFAGRVETLLPSHHAIGLRSRSGVDLLIHIGLDTVKLAGQGFTPHVQEGDDIQPGQPLIGFDMAFLAEQQIDPTTVVVVTNADEFSAVTTQGANVVSGDALITVTK
ncbi:beta-glucoside-specific PTS transporter subunit IIABC [Enterobacillus tribolii]|uniref:PTS system beta-glucosides-specific IIC component n=1 Tax=Enterobacillus tribolii TaxID=1487935 RepID=A0A370QHI3_9GAMM|nr:beta-glucoside-specific PTS transporter subunit IIABC [Enterobacillus tribolii]MBW7982543.1 PTS beta-glucoside transporter subunit EIIBCA [Enterobacillus tribolii]RDK87823.1 PTS system beta-glucosides-specific IIC component [Enterobacillus tribolii]